MALPAAITCLTASGAPAGGWTIPPVLTAIPPTLALPVAAARVAASAARFSMALSCA